MTAPRFIPGQTGGILLIGDHASNAVPEGIDLRIAPALLDKHIAIDIGTAPVIERLATQLGVPAMVATVSRLVIDLHRQPDHPGLMPKVSDGHDIPGNAHADRDDRIARFYRPYHEALAARIRETRPSLLLSIHSFTPCLEQGGTARPWEIGILSNRDRRAADLAITLLREAGVVTGDNEPYSGRALNVTLNRHGEANGIPSMAIEIRNDLIRDEAGVARWSDILAPIFENVRNSLASKGALAT